MTASCATSSPGPCSSWRSSSRRVDQLGVGKAGADRLELGGRDAMRDEPQPECVRAPDGAAGEPEIHADLARQPGEDVRDADIREEADGVSGIANA